MYLGAILFLSSPIFCSLLYGELSRVSAKYMNYIM